MTSRHHYQQRAALTTTSITPSETSAVHHLLHGITSPNSIASNHHSHFSTDYNSTGSLSSSSTSSSSSSTSSHSSSSASFHWSVQMNEDQPTEGTIVERLEQNGDKFQTPYRDENAKNEWLSTKAREILGPTNRSSLLDSSPFSETANANLLNPKSPSNDLKNRSTIRLPNRNNTNTSSSSLSIHNNLTTSNLNNVNNNPNNLLISQSSNPSQLARNNTQSSSSRSSLTTKNTSPPVKSTQASSKPAQQSMHHSASYPSLPVNKPSKKTETDIFKVFKQMQLKPYINRLDDIRSDTPVEFSKPKPVTSLTTTASNQTLSTNNESSSHHSKPIKNNNLQTSGDIELSEDDGDDSFSLFENMKQADRSMNSEPMTDSSLNNSSSYNNNKNHQIDQRTKPTVNQRMNPNFNKSAKPTETKLPITTNSSNNNNNNNIKNNGVAINGESNNNARISSVTTPTTFQRMNENPIENETTNAANQQVKPLVTDQTLSKAQTTTSKESLDDSSSSSSSDDEDSGSSSSSSSSSGSSSSSDSDDDDSSSSSSSSSSEGECSSSSNESDVETTGKDLTAAKKSKISNGKKIVASSTNVNNTSTLPTVPTAIISNSNPHKNFNLASKKTELDNTALTKKLSQVTNSAACATSASAKINLKKEDLSFNLNKTSDALDNNVDSNNKQSDDSAEMSSDKTLDECEEEDEQNITLTGMIEKIVSPNKQKNTTSSSSASSSKNTSPQLPIFSSTASVSAQLVTTINSGSKQYSLTATNPSSENGAKFGSASNNSANPSPFTDTEYAQHSNNNETSGITFTLSDDEMDGEDSNASNYNMQSALSCQISTGVFGGNDDTSEKATENTSKALEDECKKEEVVVAKPKPGSSFQSVIKTSGTLNLSNSSFKQHNSETSGHKDNKLPFSSSSSPDTKRLKKESQEEEDKSSTDNSSKKLSSSNSNSKSDLNTEESNSESKTNLAITSDNFKQQAPKPDHLLNLKKSDSEGFGNGPLSAGFVPSQGYMFNKAKSVTPPFNKSSPTKAAKETDTVKQENVSINGSPVMNTAISNVTSNPPNRKDLGHKPKESTKKKQHKSKLVVTSSSDDDEESNDDEFKAELNQYLKKRPLNSSDDIGNHYQKEDSLSKHKNQHKQHRSATPLSNNNNTNPTNVSSSSSLTPSMQHQTRTSSNSLTTPTTAPSTPALFEQVPTPNPTPTNTGKPLKASSKNQVNKPQNGISGNGAKKQRPGKFDEDSISDSALTELLTSKEKKLEEELNMLNKIAEKTRSLSSNITPTSNLKREKLSPSSQYLQQQQQQLVVNNANIVKSNKSEPYQKQPKLEATTNGNSISSDQIQYTADGRPKLIVSIELDLIKILNNQFGLPPITNPPDQFMDHDHKLSELDQMAKQKLNNMSSNSPSKTIIPSNNSHKRKDEKTHSPACHSSDTDDLSVSSSHKEKKRTDQSSSHKSSSSSSHKSSESSSHQSSRKSMASDTSKVSSSSSSTSRGSNHDTGANTSQSLKRSIQSSAGSEDLENSQRSATKKQKFIESSSKDSHKSSANEKPVTPAVNSNDNNVRQMKNKAASFSTGNAPKVGTDGVKSKSNLSAAYPAETDSKPKKMGGNKYGQYSIDFSTLEEQELHRRGKQKKHEADQEKDKFKKSIAYMEAVCYFCLCAISQYRLKKAAVNPTSNKSSFDLLNDTYQLLKYLHEKVLKSVDNDIFIKKFKVLSNWMESFINRWLWLMSLGDIRKLKESIGKQTSLMAAANAVVSSSSQKPSSQAGDKITSPNELPPPSPASSIGSSAGSLTGNKDQGASSSQTTEKESSQSQQQQISQVEIMQKLVGLYERSSRLNDYNLRSQNFWESNEIQIADIDYLNEFRETIKKQVQKELHIDCEAELFANYIITGLQLFKLKMF